MATLNVLVELQASLNRVREMRRIIKAILQNRAISHKYETYLKKETTIKSAQTIQDYVNPRHSSTVFNTFKHLDVFLAQEQEWALIQEPEKVVAFNTLNGKLKMVKELTSRLFQDAEVSKLYFEYLISEGFTNGASKRWSSPTCDMTGWFDSLEHLPRFFAKNDARLRGMLEVEVPEEVVAA